MLKNKNILAFTLVELLVVITILSILWTIWLLVLRWNIAEARDASRTNDLLEITNVLHLYDAENGGFPMPSDATPIMYEWAVGWYQWVFGESVWKDVKKFGQDVPKDPKYDNFFSYSVTAKQKEFQIASLKETLKEEDDDIWELITLSTSSVNAGNIETALVLWNYNWFMVRAQTGSLMYFVATPSIIASDISSPDVVDILSNQHLVYDNFFNIPATYSEFMDVNWWFNFNVSDPLVFSWAISELKSEEWLLEFSEKLKYIYATTPTESFDKYVSLLEKDWLTSLKGFLTRKFKIAFRTYFNCKDILDDGLADGNKMYIIDPDGEWGAAEYDVYCDMETDGWGWTRIGDNFIENWNFAWGVWVTGAFEYSNQDNVISVLPEEVDGNSFALNHTWNYSSYYQIPFPDNSLLKPGYELRLTLWRSDYWSGDVWPATSVNVMGWKYSAWTVGTCTNNCYFENLNRKLLHSWNFWEGGVLSDIEINVVNRLNSGVDITSDYLQNWVLFDGFIWSTGSSSYSSEEKEIIDDWVEAWGFLISTNNESDHDPLWEYFDMPTIQYSWQARWTVEDIDHPLINGSLWLWVDLREEELQWNYARAVLKGTLEADDTVIARDYYSPHEPTIVLRKHGKGHILFMADDGMFMNVSNNLLFEANDNESVIAAAILAYGIEKAAGINPKEGYAFHNRIYYSDGTFSINGEEEVLDTVTIDDGWTPRVWIKEMVRHTIYKEPENFDWYLGLDANNNKDLYFTGLRMELFYK
jgi:prepilin-type N-terminal cleavage/methylation domain-containing protein